jgi:hypothetical protein
MVSWRSPALLCGLAGAESGADLGPGVAAATQALDRLGYRGAEFVSEPGHESKSFYVAICHAAAVSAQDAPDERPVLVVLDVSPSPVL